MTPTQRKNLEMVLNDDEKVRKRSWFFTAFPSLKEEDFHRYISAERCQICCSKFENDRKAYKGDALCERCHNIITNTIDMEHLIQVKDYLKERKLPDAKIQDTQPTTICRSVPRPNKNTDTGTE